MKEAIIKYSQLASHKPNWWSKLEVDEFSIELMPYINKGIYFIERKHKTDFSKFTQELGYQLPDDIGEYINLFWHPYIKGFYKLDECIILFSVIKYNNESDDDVLYHKNGIIQLSKEWHSIFDGDIERYLPIGWTEFSGRYILYDIKTGKIYEEEFGNEGVPSNEPLANSLKDLILNLRTEHKRDDKA